MSEKHICLPFDSEAQYCKCVKNATLYREYLNKQHSEHPELFPQAFNEGYTFHDRYNSQKQQLELRRIKLKGNNEVFTLRPSFIMPYLVGKTDEIEKALYLRQWGVPFAALAYVFGRDAMLSCPRNEYQK